MATITGTQNNDILNDPNGNDSIDGLGGIDTLVSDFDFIDGVLFDMTTGERTFNGGVFDTFINIENLSIGGEADVIGDDNDNIILFFGTDLNDDNEAHAGGGRDTVSGGFGSDELYGDAGRDTLNGDEGDDYLYGGNAKDTLNGGKGADSLTGGSGDDTLNGQKGADNMYGNEGNDILNGGKGNDSLFGDAGNDFLDGGKGNDTLFGADGDDTLDGGKGDDTLFADAGNDTLKGGKGSDTMFGADGEDILKGGKGSDQLYGWDDDDILTGGKGADVFHFVPDGSFDVVEDYKDGKDLINLAGFGFVDAEDALSHFFERGSSSNDVVGFEYEGTEIKINGADLADIDAEDIII